jgi:TonB family protein
MKILYIITLTLTVLANTIFAQQIEIEKGIELYKQGKNQEAIKIFEKLSKQKDTKTEIKVWNYLGLAYLENGDLKKARKALEKADKLSPNNSAVKTNLGYAYLVGRKINDAQTHLNEAIRIEPKNFLAYYFRGTSFLWQKKYDQALSDAEKAIALQAKFSSAYILKADVLTNKFGQQVVAGSSAREASDFLRQAVEILENCAKNCQPADFQPYREKFEALKVFYEYFSRNKIDSADLNADADENTATVTETNVTPLKILSRPRPSYTDRARRAGISGSVKLYVLFGANGKILNIIGISGLGYGLDEEAIKAARQIKFEPKTENGKPVSVVKMVIFTFTIY